MPSICLVYGFVVACGGLARQFCILHSTFFLHLGARVAEQPVGSEVMPEFGRFFPGATRAVVQKPTDEANGCKLRRIAPEMLQKAQYVGFLESSEPLQVVRFGWPRFPVPGSAPRMSAGPIYGLTIPMGTAHHGE